MLAVLGWLLSGAIHELGHVFAAKMAGLQVIHMQPWAIFGRVHVRFAGETTDAWYAAINLSGMLLTFLTGVTGTVVTSVVARRFPAIKRAAWLFIPMMGQSLAWVALPLAMALGVRTPNDDVARFIQNSGWNPFMVLALGLGLVGICGAALFRTFNPRAETKDVAANGS